MVLNEFSLSIQASIITRIIKNVISYLNKITNELFDNIIIQVIQGKLLDNGFLNTFILEIRNIIKGMNPNILVKNFLIIEFRFT